MVQPDVHHNQQIIDLISDDEDDGFSDDGFSDDGFSDDGFSDDGFSDDGVVYHAPRSVGGSVDDEIDSDPDELGLYVHDEVDDPDIVDLTAIPDIDIPPSDHSPGVVENPVPTEAPDEAELISEAICLQLVLDVFPDVSIDHVLAMIRERTTDLTRTKEHSERIVDELLDGSYLKEAEMTSKKRKREDSEGLSDYENDEREVGAMEHHDTIEILKDEFLLIPVRHITNTAKEHKTLFRTYIVLEEQLRNYRNIARTFVRSSRPRNKRGVELQLIEVGSQLPKELRAAKKKVESEAVKRRKMEETKRAEEANLEHAQTANLMGECQCCFTEYPLNRMISCSDEDMHLFCMDCPKQYIETEMGQSKCRPKCFASTECKGTFSRAQLQQVLGSKSFERLEHVQQQQDIAAAGLDFLSECPFCDYKAECLPVEVDKEFRCQNTKCGKTSCRLCDKETHIPLSCEEAKKNGQLTLRHVVEEAMSAALIRKCNNCQRPFIKEYGCNKMSCSHCGNKQCYLCSKNVKNYEHFGDTSKGRCALHDNVEDVHEQAVKKAADNAMAQVRAENPGLSDADLMIQVSERVKQAEAARKGRAAERLNEFPYEMHGDQLAHRFGLPGVAPLLQEGNRAPPRPIPRLGGLFAAAYNGVVAAAGIANPVQALPNQPFHHGQDQQDDVAARHRPQPQLRMHRHFENAIDPLVPLDPQAQAAQDRFHQQLQAANLRRLRADRDVLRAADVQMADRAAARLEARHFRRMEEMQNRYVELERRVRQMPHVPPLPTMPAFGQNGVGADARNAGAAAGPGGGLAFGGLDANRAARGRQIVDDWLDEELRNELRH